MPTMSHPNFFSSLIAMAVERSALRSLEPQTANAKPPSQADLTARFPCRTIHR
jgi:hypothetical protein